MADIYPRESAIVFKTVVDNVLEMKDEPEVQKKFAISVLEYLIYGRYNYEDDPIIRGLMKQPMELSDRTAVRYDKIKGSAAAGGAVTKGKRERWTNEDVYQYYKIDGHTLQEAVEHFGYSKRTIQEKCKRFLSEEKEKLVINVEEAPKPEEIITLTNGEWKF